MGQVTVSGRPKKQHVAKINCRFYLCLRRLRVWVATPPHGKVHVIIAILAIVMGIALRISTVEFAIVFVAITGVFMAELFNTVFELCVDLASPEYHPLAKVAKDMAAGGVLLSAMLSIMVGLLVFGPHLWALLRR